MVYLIGAGPGAIDLITIRGQKILSMADVIIYAGSLVNPELLDYKKADCLVYNSASMTLEEVITVISEAKAQGKTVARLHTGDPAIYGAIHEQMVLLDEQQIAYQVVPGVSSFNAAAATLKAELTLPGISQTVILTRMQGRTSVPEKEELSKLAAHNATMVIFLSTGLLAELSASLLAGGYHKQTKAAIVYKASWPDEKIIRTTIEKLPQAAIDNNIQKTALIFIGEFLGSEYERSQLYHPAFSHEFRAASKQ